MSDDYWQRQTDEAPLYPDILWSRPETKHGAGRLLIVGGNSFGFAAPGTAYSAAVQAGIGTARVLLPEALRPVVGSHLLEADFAPDNPSGSFAKQALEPLLSHAHWAEAVLLAGDLGRNSETAVTLEQFTKKYNGLLAVTKDATDYFLKTPQDVLDRPDTLLVVSIEQLQKLAAAAHYEEPLLFSMGASLLAAWLHGFTARHPAHIILCHDHHYFVASTGRVASQRVADDEKIWRVKTAARAAVLWLQNTRKPFEAIVTSLLAPISVL
jgi:hypothetical protein